MTDAELDTLVLSQIPEGAEHARKSRAIALRLDLDAAMSEWGCSAVRMSVRRLRENYLIAGGQNGYYIPVTEAEIHAGAMNLLTRIRGLAETLKMYDKQAAENLTRFLGQLVIWDKEVRDGEHR